jgi:hypothetical protein
LYSSWDPKKADHQHAMGVLHDGNQPIVVSLDVEYHPAALRISPWVFSPVQVQATAAAFTATNESSVRARCLSPHSFKQRSGALGILTVDAGDSEEALHVVPAVSIRVRVR